MKNMNLARGLVLLISVGLASCTSLNSSVGTYLGLDTDLQVEFVVDPDINPDEIGKASPLFVRMYELKTQKMMTQADFIRIYEGDKEALGEDLVSVHKLRRFKPGEGRTEHFVLDKKTRYVAFFAEFLKFREAKYKVIVPVVESNVVQTAAIIHLSGNQISIANR